MNKNIEAPGSAGNDDGGASSAKRARETAAKLIQAADRVLDPGLDPAERATLGRMIDRAAAAFPDVDTDRRARVALLGFINGQAKYRAMLLLARACAKRRLGADLKPDERTALDRFERRERAGKAAPSDFEAVRMAAQSPNSFLDGPPLTVAGFSEHVIWQFAQEYPHYGKQLRAARPRLEESIAIWEKRGAPLIEVGSASRKWQLLAQLMTEIGLEISEIGLESDWNKLAEKDWKFDLALK